MKDSFGKRFQELRKEKKMTQEEVAERLNISSQAVSKWENDISYPDISLLVEIANMFGTSVDTLLGKDEDKPVVALEKRDPNKMFLKINVHSAENDKVKVNLPLALIKALLSGGVAMPKIGDKDILKEIDFKMVMELVEQGVIGKIIEINSADGDIVEVYVE